MEPPTRRAAPRHQSLHPDEPPRPSHRNLRHDDEIRPSRRSLRLVFNQRGKTQSGRDTPGADNINVKRVSVQHSVKPNNVSKRAYNNRSGPVKQHDGSKQDIRRARHQNSTSIDLNHPQPIRRSELVTYTKTRFQSP